VVHPAETLAKASSRPIPHRIEHGGVVTDLQVTQAAGLGVAIVTQPGFMPTLGVQMREAMGPQRERFLHHHKSLLDNDILATDPQSLPDIQVVETWIGGKKVFQS
jgi:predicted amidohydrolase YtcJ